MEKHDIEKALLKIKNKIDVLMERVDPDSPMCEWPHAIDGKYTNKMSSLLDERIDQWTHSFLTGMVAYMYFHFKEEKYLDYLMRQKKVYGVYFDNVQGSHDIGFLFSLFAVALYKVSGDEEAKKMAMKAAEELSKRFQIRPELIQSFYGVRHPNVTEKTSMMIADTMMNLPLLMWAYNEIPYYFYSNVVKYHIETTMKYLVRDDFSIRHAYNFDVNTGKPIAEQNFCGYGIGSAWARGTAWIIYGLALAQKQFDNTDMYVNSYVGISEYFYNQLPDDGIPVWDFKLPAYETPIVDTSAAAIAACGFMQMEENKISPLHRSEIEKYAKMSDKILESLLSDRYFADDNVEFLLDKGQAGKENTGTIWGDYFLVELIMRKLHKDDFVSFWI